MLGLESLTGTDRQYKPVIRFCTQDRIAQIEPGYEPAARSRAEKAQAETRADARPPSRA